MRMIDANINRVCEGLRVCEDILRFEIDEKIWSSQLKSLRHDIRNSFKTVLTKNEDIPPYLQISRDAEGDSGRPFQAVEADRLTLEDMFRANCLRAEEGLRALEEACKLEPVFQHLPAVMKEYRFKLYQMEKGISATFFGYNLSPGSYNVIRCNNLANNKTAVEVADIVNKTVGFVELQFENCCVNDIFTLLKTLFQTSEGSEKRRLLIRNRFDMAMLFPGAGLVIDSNYLPLQSVRGVFRGLLGFHLQQGEVAGDLLSSGIQFVICTDSIKPDIINHPGTVTIVEESLLNIITIEN